MLISPGRGGVNRSVFLLETLVEDFIRVESVGFRGAIRLCLLNH